MSVRNFAITVLINSSTYFLIMYYTEAMQTAPQVYSDRPQV